MGVRNNEPKMYKTFNKAAIDKVNLQQDSLIKTIEKAETDIKNAKIKLKYCTGDISFI